MELCVELPDFGDGVDFPWVVIPALDAKHESVHHVPQSPSRRQFSQCKKAEEIFEVSALHFLAAELVGDQIEFHAAKL